MKEAIKILENIEDKYHQTMYPGYPFSVIGYVDLETGKASINRKDFNDVETFSKEFDALLCYHLIDCIRTRKGSWIIDSYMPNHEDILKAGDDDFEVGNFDIARLYFATYAAIRESKNTKNIIFFYYDGESEFADVKVFTNVEDLAQYEKEYWTFEE